MPESNADAPPLMGSVHYSQLLLHGYLPLHAIHHDNEIVGDVLDNDDCVGNVDDNDECAGSVEDDDESVGKLDFNDDSIDIPILSSELWNSTSKLPLYSTLNPLVRYE